MSTWLIDGPQRLTIDGEVSALDVWLAQGKLRVVGTDGPARIEVRRVGRKGLTVTLEDGVLSVRHPLKRGWRHWAGPFWWFIAGRRSYSPTSRWPCRRPTTGSLTVIAGDVVASGLRRGATVDVTSGSITLMGLGGTVRAKTVSGSIEAMGVAGDLGMKTVSGEIALAESSAERVVARTISGPDHLRPRQPVRPRRPAGHDVGLHHDPGARGRRPRREPHRHQRAGDQRVPAGPGQLAARHPLRLRPASAPGRARCSAYAVSGSVSLLARPAVDRADFDGPEAREEP